MDVANAVVVQSVVCCQDFTSKPTVAPLCIVMCPMALSRSKHDMGALLWLNVETLERVPAFLFGRLVMCSTHGHSFTRLWYTLHVKL